MEMTEDERVAQRWRQAEAGHQAYLDGGGLQRLPPTATWADATAASPRAVAVVVPRQSRGSATVHSVADSAAGPREVRPRRVVGTAPPPSSAASLSSLSSLLSAISERVDDLTFIVRSVAAEERAAAAAVQSEGRSAVPLLSSAQSQAPSAPQSSAPSPSPGASSLSLSGS